MDNATHELLMKKVIADPTILQRYREASQAALETYRAVANDESTTLGEVYSTAVQAMSIYRKYVDILEIVLQLSEVAVKCRQIVDMQKDENVDDEEEIEF